MESPSKLKKPPPIQPSDFIYETKEGKEQDELRLRSMQGDFAGVRELVEKGVDFTARDKAVILRPPIDSIFLI